MYSLKRVKKVNSKNPNKQKKSFHHLYKVNRAFVISNSLYYFTVPPLTF
jgi:hypothetical protein